MTFPLLTKDFLTEILESEGPYANDDEKAACQRLVEELTPEEQHSAACTSYAYWYAMTFAEKIDMEAPLEETRIRMAMREARRHLVGSNQDETAALQRFRECCHFRQEYHVDLFRTCYPIVHANNSTKEIHQGTPEEEEIKAKFRRQIEEELNFKQQFFVRGMDRQSRAVAIKMGRQSPETDHEAFITTQLYVAERAIACTELFSRGTEEKVLAVMDFQNYSSSNAPPLSTLKESIALLQNNYPERLKTAIITEPPFWMKGFYNLIYPFMSYDTREKIQMAYGKGKHETISALLEPEQAMPFMMPEGQLDSPLDVDKFLKEVPFYSLYDDKGAK